MAEETKETKETINKIYEHAMDHMIEILKDCDSLEEMLIIEHYIKLLTKNGIITALESHMKIIKTKTPK